MKKILSGNYSYPVILVFLWSGLIFFTVPKGYIYGSAVDWFSQHTALAETIRKACLEQETLLPAFLNLGGGTNGFAFSYYGYLRPDIILGCLLPQIPMYRILIIYMLLGYVVSVLLCCRWLEVETKSHSEAFFGSILFMLSACFFHTHRQVMFINYMPFLMGALLSIKKKHYGRTVVFLTFSCLNSFYYMPAILVVVLWYWYRTEGNHFLSEYIKAVFFVIGMAAMLLIPTFLVILEHHRNGTEINRIPGFIPEMNFLLYSPYGIGVTLLCLYLLISGMASKIYRKDSMMLLIVCSFGIFAWLLNGGLYARGKILVPFLPLIILQSTRVLLSMHRKEMKWQLWPFVFIFFFLFSCRSQAKAPGMALDALFLLLFCAGKRYFMWGYPYIYVVLFVMPSFFWMQSVQQETFVPSEKIQEIESARTFLQTDALYRYDSLYEPLATGNRYASISLAKSAMYSSVTNQAYAKVYYDILKTPIQINNRIALLPAENPFLLQFMGVRYLHTTKDKVPEGYEIMKEEGNRVFAENPSVLPIAYTVDKAISENNFERLGEMERLDVLTRYTVIEETAIQTERMESEENGEDKEESVRDCQTQYRESAFRSTTPVFLKTEQSENLQLTEYSDSCWEIRAKGDASLTLSLDEPVKEDILLLEFEVENLEKNAIVIDMNGIRNKLSGADAPYPNGNKRFCYQFSEAAEGIKTLTVNLSGGHYRISGIRWYLYKKTLLTQKDYIDVSPCSTQGNEILACQTNNDRDGYFITSIPKQNGLKILMDGIPVPVLTVNTAFAGAELTAGAHDIKIVFSPPGLSAGKLISMGTMFMFLAYCFTRKRRTIFNKKWLT